MHTFEAVDNVLGLLADGKLGSSAFSTPLFAICQTTQHHLHRYKGILIVTMKSCVNWVCSRQAATEGS